MRRVPEGAGRYDRLHGDEPFIEAERRGRERDREEWLADHWDEWEPLEALPPLPEDDLADLFGPYVCAECGMTVEGEHWHDPD